LRRLNLTQLDCRHPELRAELGFETFQQLLGGGLRFGQRESRRAAAGHQRRPCAVFAEKLLE